MKRKEDQMAKLRPLWDYGIFVGVRRKSGELWVAEENVDIRKVRTAKRIPEEER